MEIMSDLTLVVLKVEPLHCYKVHDTRDVLSEVAAVPPPCDLVFPHLYSSLLDEHCLSPTWGD